MVSYSSRYIKIAHSFYLNQTADSFPIVLVKKMSLKISLQIPKKIFQGFLVTFKDFLKEIQGLSAISLKIIPSVWKSLNFAKIREFTIWRWWDIHVSEDRIFTVFHFSAKRFSANSVKIISVSKSFWISLKRGNLVKFSEDRIFLHFREFSENHFQVSKNSWIQLNLEDRPYMISYFLDSEFSEKNNFQVSKSS